MWVEAETTALKEGRGTEVVAVAEATGGLRDPLDFGVDALGDGVGDPVRQVRDDVVKVGLEHPGHLLDGLEPGADRPAIPLVEELPGPCGGHVAPEVRERLDDRPGPGRLEVAGPNLTEVDPTAAVEFVLAHAAAASRRIEECTQDPQVGQPGVWCWEDRSRLDVFDLNGRYLGEARFPDGVNNNLSVAFIRDDMAIRPVEDEDGVIKVKRYRLLLPRDSVR